MKLPMPNSEIMQLVKKGAVIPASPLALDKNKKLDEKYQRAIYRYYVSAGVGGIAVGVHTTQFEIREPKYELFEPLLYFASETIDDLIKIEKKPIIKIAGICGKTNQALKEAVLSTKLGYDIALLSLGALKEESEDALIKHCREISHIIPIFGFYLQPAVGGRILPYTFWRKFVDIENVVGIKIAPFNRYFTLDVIRAVAHAGRDNEITLYTGNDDNIILDLLTPFTIRTDRGIKILRIKGGLLGQWAIWTKTAVTLLDEIQGVTDGHTDIPVSLLQKNTELTEANSVIFDVSHHFAGCISGIHEILRRQGLIRYSHCLNPKEKLSPGQSNELDRIHRDYPWLNDDDFVRRNLDKWLK